MRACWSWAACPGAASLQADQYYAHPHNRFWPIMGDLVGALPALPYAQRLLRLKQSGIALWDVFDTLRTRWQPGFGDSR